MSAREEQALRELLRAFFLTGVLWGMALLAVAIALLGCGRGPVCVPPKSSGALPKPGNDAPSSPTTCPVQR